MRSKEIFSVTADNKLEVEAYVESKEESALDDTEEIASNLTTFNIGKLIMLLLHYIFIKKQNSSFYNRVLNPLKDFTIG